MAVVGVGVPSPEFFDDGVGGDGEAFVADEQFEELAFFEGEVEFLGLAEQVAAKCRMPPEEFWFMTVQVRSLPPMVLLPQDVSQGTAQW